MATKLLCLSAAATSPFAKAFLEYLAKTHQVEYDFAEIEPHILSNPKFPLSKLLSHFCSSTPDFIMTFDGHYRNIKIEPKIPFIEMSDSIAGPIRHNRAFVKHPVEWERKVIKVEPAWYSKILPLEDPTIYQMIDSYRYVYLRKLVEEYKKAPVKAEAPLAFYIPDWNTHTDDILQNVYKYLDFCRDVGCGLYVGMSKAVLDHNDLSLEEKYRVKRKSIDTTLKIMQEDMNKFNKEYEEDGILARMTENSNWRSEILKHDIKLLSVEFSSSTWLEAIYLLRTKEVAVNKIRLKFENCKKFPGSDSLDSELPMVEKYFGENLMRKDRTATLGPYYTTTDKFFHFLGFQDNFSLQIDFGKIASLLPKTDQ